MVSGSTARKEIEDSLVRAYEDAYKDLWETWKITEVKAQGAIVASGFFLAALVAFLTKSAGSQQAVAGLPIFTKIAIATVTICVSLVITFASLALFVREVEPFPQSGYLPGYFNDALKEPDEKLEEEQRKLRLHQLDMWKDCISDVESKTQRKVAYLHKAQVTILLATFLVGLFIIVKVFFQTA